MKNLIKKLASKELSFGCRMITPNTKQEYILTKEFKDACEVPYWHAIFGDETLTKQNISSEMVEKSENLGHPIYLGDVLERINIVSDWFKISDCILLWAKCVTEEEKREGKTGFAKSLQQIAEKSGYMGERLKDPNARALEEILNKIL